MDAQAGGTLTFLFTDIEGSTRLVRRLRERYADALAEHQRVLRTAFAEAGGEEIGMQGDSFFVAFRRPKDAVLAAAAGQRRLAECSWPEDVQVRVRMGIHTGEAARTADSYLGLAVHRAARICAAGHGGQVLISQTTHALLEDEEQELPDVAQVDLGPQRLKDFDRPVRLYQLVVPGLPESFPPLRTLDNAGADDGAIPFAGHEEDLAEAAARRTSESEPATGGVRVLIVDDQALVRTGFRMILDAEPGLEVVGEAADGREAVEEARRLQPDIVLMDVRMPELDGIEATRQLMAEGSSLAKVVMLTTFDMDEYVYEALRAGASGFLLKDVPPEQLVAGIEAVASGDALLAPSITRRVIEEFVRHPPESVRKPPAAIEELTEREREVLALIARGLSNAEIAKELVVSETTVKTHVARVLQKLDLRDRVQAVVFAYETGLVHPGES
jgi:DNA-binding NarL/FixJ family response regulator/class 3 adenylate cyclase